jgi:hypothetical protein
MRKAATRLGAAIVLAAGGVLSSHAISGAAGHQVRYTVSTGQETSVNINYLATEPPSQSAYNANGAAFMRNESVAITPGSPWVFETTLNDTSWACVMAGGATHYYGTPNPHCDIAIDGNVVTQQDGDTAVTCALKRW